MGPKSPRSDCLPAPDSFTKPSQKGAKRKKGREGKEKKSGSIELILRPRVGLHGSWKYGESMISCFRILFRCELRALVESPGLTQSGKGREGERTSLKLWRSES